MFRRTGDPSSMLVIASSSWIFFNFLDILEKLCLTHSTYLCRFVFISFHCKDRVRRQTSTHHDHSDPRSLQDPEISRKIVAPPASATNITIASAGGLSFHTIACRYTRRKFGENMYSGCYRPILKPENIPLQWTLKLNHFSFKKKKILLNSDSILSLKLHRLGI